MRASQQVMADLAATGLSAEQVALVMELTAVVATEARPIEDEAANRRRAKDREYKAAKRRQNLPTSADSADIPPPPNDIYSNPPPLPFSNENGADQSDEQFWDGAKRFLKPERANPGPMIGKWCRDYGKQETAAALTRAQLERPVQRVPFIEGILRKQVKARPSVPL